MVAIILLAFIIVLENVCIIMWSVNAGTSRSKTGGKLEMNEIVEDM